MIKRKNKQKTLRDILDLDNKMIFTQREKMTIDDIKEKCKDIDNEILTFLRVSKVFVFGSYALDQATEYSDIDFIVLTDNKNSNPIETTALLKKEFKKHFGNKINLVCADVNKNISKFVISNILTSKLVLDYAEL